MANKLLHRDLTDAILRSFYQVHNSLGFGFLEKVYENAMVLTLRRQGLDVWQQKAIRVYYEDSLVGEYFADLLVAQKVIVELKAGESLSPAHEAQLMNYLKATELEVGLLLNFGEVPEFRRRIFTNDFKRVHRRRT
jgi:GxxExxY protein